MRLDQPKPDQLDPDCVSKAQESASQGRAGEPVDSSPDERQQSLIELDMLSRRRALTYLVAQFALSLLLSALLLVYDIVSAYSALTGGMIATVASAWFTWRVYRVGATSAASAMLASVYVGEVYKLVLTGALFVCAFVLISPLNAPALFLTYFLVHITPLLVSIFDPNVEDIKYKRPGR
jgi:ATP synthase protein I